MGNSPLCGIKIAGNIPLCCIYIYINGQNECCAIRTLSALVGGSAIEDAGVEFTRRNYPDVYNIGDFAGAYIATFCTQKIRYACTHLPPLRRSLSCYPDLRQHLGSHQLPPIGHVGTTCKKSFTRRAYLPKYSSRCVPQAYVCNVCHCSFGRIWDLARHERTFRCGGPKEPESAPKRRKKLEYVHEDTTIAPDDVQLDAELSAGLHSR